MRDQQERQPQGEPELVHRCTRSIRVSLAGRYRATAIAAQWRAKAGKIPAVKIGGILRIPIADLEKAMAVKRGAG